MIARNRKVIVVCHSCHQNITHGRYDGRKLNQGLLEAACWQTSTSGLEEGRWKSVLNERE